MSEKYKDHLDSVRYAMLGGYKGHDVPDDDWDYEWDDEDDCEFENVGGVFFYDKPPESLEDSDV